jgi:hypothetical protein
LRILIHETIHALGVGCAEYGRERAEVIVAFSCCQTIGLDTSANSIPYLTSWAEDASLEVLEQTAALTGRLADRIEGALFANPASLQPGDQEVVDAPEAVAV